MVARLMYAVAAFVAGLVAAPAPAGAPLGQLAASHQQRPLVQRLSLQQLAGQRIVYAYSGLKPPASLLAAIRAGEPLA
jgi:beta-N-acetylhexosaminidase